MDRCSSFIGKYLAGFLVLSVWLTVVVAADPADHAKSGADNGDEDFDVVLRRSNSPGPMGKDGNKGGDMGGSPQGGQDDESYRRFLINALMGMKQQQWGWMGASGGPQAQQPVYTAPPPTSQDQPPVAPQPQQPPPPPQQPPPVAPQPPPPPPPPQQPPQQQMPSMCPQYSVIPQATPPPMQAFAEKLHPQFGQCVTVLLPSPAAIPTYNNLGQNPMADPNMLHQPIPGCRGGCNGRTHAPRRPYY